MSVLRGMCTITYWAEDVAAAVDWYREYIGADPYFRNDGPDGKPAYVEFRIGDHQAELGICDSRYAPPGTTGTPGGVVTYWAVDDLEAAVERAIAMGAETFQPITERGTGFRTASVADPFGNILGLMSNAHYLEMLG
ncbi:VOC family protein [Phytomonospora endophytica]|uniref:Putative enzyme related to lactoylglutathione lyase n=1 Tax=Phytomonospora endophytica TaxID=714109 RepID=A0A841FPK2_9ACTN|nr:VOC family protein [Phytomonospora endophytica]MBB6038045.1 putative enzyme related to lactoylglutathione lyase [Phytomonospora endophytica]GIG67491.1 glyoxalase [Phytomonospora endophytica]